MLFSSSLFCNASSAKTNSKQNKIRRNKHPLLICFSGCFCLFTCMRNLEPQSYQWQTAALGLLGCLGYQESSNFLDLMSTSKIPERQVHQQFFLFKKKEIKKDECLSFVFLVAVIPDLGNIQNICRNEHISSFSNYYIFN